MTALILVGQAVQQTPVEKLANALTSGIALGGIYAMLALGFVIIFKATQVVNFAHGAIAALGAYFVAYFATVLEVPARWMGDTPTWISWSLAVVLAMGATAIVGMIAERVTIRPMIGEPLFAVAMITLGLDLIIRTFTNDLMDNDVNGLGDPWGAAFWNVGGVRIAHTQVVTVGVLIAVVLLLVVFFRSRTGIAMSATAFDQEAAMAQGISVGRIFATAWAIGAALAALGGLFASVAPRAAGVSPVTAFIAFRAFPVVIIGGLDSISGAIIAGLMVGVAEVFAGVYLGSVSWLGIGFSGIVPWLLMMAVLIVKPYGLFGTEEVRRV